MNQYLGGTLRVTMYGEGETRDMDTSCGYRFGRKPVYTAGTLKRIAIKKDTPVGTGSVTVKLLKNGSEVSGVELVATPQDDFTSKVWSVSVGVDQGDELGFRVITSSDFSNNWDNYVRLIAGFEVEV